MGSTAERGVGERSGTRDAARGILGPGRPADGEGFGAGDAAHASVAPEPEADGAPDGIRPPGFFVVGAAKAGTTALHHFLAAHPDVALPARKETNFYALDGGPPAFRGPLDDEAINTFSVWKREAYQAEFGHAAPGMVLGEVCPSYLYSERAAWAIRADNPHAKVVIVLRDPVDRAFSAYRHLVRDGRETRTFAEALALEDRRIRDGWEWFWHLASVSRYADQVERYLREFGRESVAVFRYEDLRNRTDRVLAELLAFLEIEPAGPLELRQQTMTSAVGVWSVRLRALVEGPGSLRKVLSTVVPARVRAAFGDALGVDSFVRPRLDPGLRLELTQEFGPDVRRVQALTGLDLSGWMRT